MIVSKHALYGKYNFGQLENMWMPLVLDAITELIKTDQMCDCTECVLDVTALSLNQLPCNYWVSGAFNAFLSPDVFIKDEKNQQRALDAVRQSWVQVEKHPHH